MSLRLGLCLLLAAGCLDSEPEEVGTTTGEASVTWSNLVGVTASGSDLSKTASTSAWDAGAVSVETLASDGYVELTVGETGTNKAAGLSSGDGGQHYSDIDFALRFTANGAVQVYEGGVLRGSFGSYQAGDRFRVEVKDGSVRYSRSGAAPFYTSATVPSFPLLVDTALYAPGATINDVELVTTGLTWQNVVGVAASGDTLTKTAGTSGWTAGAASVQTLAGDGFLEFAVADNTTAKAAGLSSGDSDQSYTDIDYGLRLNANGVVYVYEAGVLRGNFGSYLAGDRFRVEVSGGVVSYSRNGGLPFYTSAVPPTLPLLVDTAFSTPGATLTDLALVEAASACPAYDGTGPVCSGSFTVENSIDLAEIASCANITGNLTITAAGMTEIALPLLERIGGNLTVEGNIDMARLRLPALKEIGGDTRLVVHAATGGVDLSHLRTTGRLETQMFGSLETNVPCLDISGTLNAREWNGSTLVNAPIHVPRLRQVVGSVERGVIVAPVLTTVDGDVSADASLDAPVLADIGGTLRYGSGHQLPALTTLGDLRLTVLMPELPSLLRIRRTLIAGNSSTSSCLQTDVPVTFDLPSLERVGTLHICWDDVQEVSLPQLQTVTSFFIWSTGITEPVTLPSLTRVSGKLGTRVPLDLPALLEIRGGLDMFAPVSAPVLATIGGRANLGVTGASISLPALTSAGAIECCGLTTSVDLPALTQVGAFGGSGKVDVTGYATAISMPLLESTTGDFSIVRTYRLTTIDFSSLTSVGPQLLINRNRELPECYATNLFDQLVASGWSGTASIYGNNGTGTCP